MHTDKEIVTTAFSKLTPIAITPFMNKRAYSLEIEYPDASRNSEPSGLYITVSHEEIEEFKKAPEKEYKEGKLKLAGRDIVQAYQQVDLSKFEGPSRDDPRWQAVRSELSIFEHWIRKSDLDKIAQKIITALDIANR